MWLRKKALSGYHYTDSPLAGPGGVSITTQSQARITKHVDIVLGPGDLAGLVAKNSAIRRALQKEIPRNSRSCRV